MRGLMVSDLPIGPGNNTVLVLEVFISYGY